MDPMNGIFSLYNLVDANSRLDIYPDSGYIVAVMSNVDQGAGPLASKVGERSTTVTR